MNKQYSFEDYEEINLEHEEHPEFICPHTGKICCTENQSEWCTHC